MFFRSLFLIGLIFFILSLAILAILLIMPQLSSATVIVPPINRPRPGGPGGGGGVPVCVTCIANQPVENLLIDKYWPDQINMNTSDTIRVLLRSPYIPNKFVATAGTEGNYKVAEETPPSLDVGTPSNTVKYSTGEGIKAVVIGSAFGVKYQPFVAAHLVTSTFDIRPIGQEEKQLDLAGVESVEWEWNVSPKALGRQVINVDIELTWKSKDNGQVVEQVQIWQSQFIIKVVQPFFDSSQLTSGALVSLLLGFSSIFASIIAWGLSQISKQRNVGREDKTKEASQNADGTGIRPPSPAASPSPPDSQTTAVTNALIDRRGPPLTSAASPPSQLDVLSHKANAYYTDLQVYSREHTPAEWAATQNNLGTTLVAQARLVEGPERQRLFVQAVTAYRSALEVHTPESTPTQWATEQSNLGNALSALAQLAQGSEQRDLLTQAATAYQAALQIYTPEQTPAQWARAQVHLARVQLIMASLENDAESRCSMLREASQRVEDTLSFFRQDENSVSSQQAIQLYRTIQEQMQASGCHPLAGAEI